MKNMKDNGLIIKDMVKVNLFMQMVIHMKENFKWIKCTVKVNMCIHAGIHTKVDMLMIKWKPLVHILGLTDKNMKE